MNLRFNLQANKHILIHFLIFRLGYFERNFSFYNQSQLTSELTRHYAQQAIKQMYVLVLGLDVLGNPFGLIRGMAEGIEDLFYEPYQVSVLNIYIHTTTYPQQKYTYNHTYTTAMLKPSQTTLYSIRTKLH